MHMTIHRLRSMRTGLLLFILLSFTACDYWPPALQDHIEELRTHLNDAMDDRQRLEVEVIELRAAQVDLERNIEERARENAALQQRLTALSRRPSHPSSAAQTASGKIALAKTRTMPHNPVALSSSIRKGPYVALQLEHPHRQGPQVERIQRLLRRHDFPIRADGIFGRS